LDGPDHCVVTVAVIDLNVEALAHPPAQQGLAQGGLLADQAVECVLPHGGDDLIGLLVALVLQIDRHPVVEPHGVGIRPVGDDHRGADHVLQKADPAFVAVLLLLGGLVLKVLAQIAEAAGLLDGLQQLGPELDAAVVQFLPHEADILLRQFIVHGR